MIVVYDMSRGCNNYIIYICLDHSGLIYIRPDQSGLINISARINPALYISARINQIHHSYFLLRDVDPDGDGPDLDPTIKKKKTASDII